MPSPSAIQSAVAVPRARGSAGARHRTSIRRTANCRCGAVSLLPVHSHHMIRFRSWQGLARCHTLDQCKGLKSTETSSVRDPQVALGHAALPMRHPGPKGSTSLVRQPATSILRQGRRPGASDNDDTLAPMWCTT